MGLIKCILWTSRGEKQIYTTGIMTAPKIRVILVKERILMKGNNRDEYSNSTHTFK